MKIQLAKTVDTYRSRIMAKLDLHRRSSNTRSAMDCSSEITMTKQRHLIGDGRVFCPNDARDVDVERFWGVRSSSISTWFRGIRRWSAFAFRVGI